MQAFLNHCSRRYGYDGWAVRIRGANSPLWWTTSTTRAEVRKLLRERAGMFHNHDLEIIKVRVSVTPAEGSK